MPPGIPDQRTVPFERTAVTRRGSRSGSFVHMLRNLLPVTALASILACVPCIALTQSLSWVRPIDDEQYPQGLIHRSDGNIAVITGTGTWRSTLATYDWQGNRSDSLDLPRPTFVDPIDDGFVIAGRFIGSLEIADDTIQGGTGWNDIYIARFDGADELQWVISSKSTSNSMVMRNMTVSPNGRIAIIIEHDMSFTIGEDTIPNNPGHDWKILSFAPSGDLEWQKPLYFTTNSTAFYDTNMSYDNTGRLWIAATLEYSMIVDGDTLEVSGPDQYDHAIIEFAPDGGLLAHTIVPYEDQPARGMRCDHLIPHPDGGVLWMGTYLNGTTLNGTVLDSAGNGSNALIMRLDSLLEMQWHTVFGADSSEVVTVGCIDGSTGKIHLAGIAGNGTVIGPDTFPSDPVWFGFLMTMDSDGMIENGQFYCGSTVPWSGSPYELLCVGGQCHILGTTGMFELFTDGTLLQNAHYLARFDAEGTTSITTAARSNASFQIIPCPSQGPVDLRLHPSHDGRYNVSVMNALGETVRQEVLFFIAGTAHLDLSGLAGGIYTIHLNTAEGPVVCRTIIE